MNKLVCLLVLGAVVSCVYSAPSLDRKNIRKTATFLLKFGYLDLSTDSAGANDPNSPVFKSALRRLQQFGNIRVTGKLDEQTVKLISTSRCGVRDPNRSPAPRGVGEFNLHNSFWNKTNLTFKIMNYTSDGIPHETQREIFREALNMWQAVSSLQITEVESGDADILISYVTNDHWDGYPFDGEGGTLAHAFYPHNNQGLAGDAHFDDDEFFTTERKDGINLDWVAVHEFGHSLGLEHSNVGESIMFPWYKGYVPDVKLTSDDIQGIQARYGKPSLTTTTEAPTSTEPPTTTVIPTATEQTTATDQPTTTVPSVHPACSPGTRYDAVFVGANSLTYFFKGDLFWTVNKFLVKSKPKQVKDYWPKVQTPVDAAYRNKKRSIVFFKGSKFWEYRNGNIMRESSIHKRPYRLRHLRNINAVFTFRGNQMTYFFKGTRYWRYNDQKRKAVRGYPRNINRGWPNVVNNLDAAVTWPINKKTYIFKGQLYYRLKADRKNGKISVERGYPKPISARWMRCATPGMLSLIGSLNLATP